MKKKDLILLLVAVVLIAAIVAVCFSDAIQLRFALNRYNRILDEELPEDLTLTIYYVPYYIVTRAPLSVEDLMDADFATKIVVKSDELARNLATLKTLNASVVQPAGEEYGINARIYYVLEAGNQKLLEVFMQQFGGESEAVAAFVNGIPVEKNPVLYEILLPFLSEEDKNAMGIPDVPPGAVDFAE